MSFFTSTRVDLLFMALLGSRLRNLLRNSSRVKSAKEFMPWMAVPFTEDSSLLRASINRRFCKKISILLGSSSLL